MTMRSVEGDSVLERCSVTVSSDDGMAIARYKWSHLEREGSVTSDDSLEGYTDDEVRAWIGDQIDIHEGDRHEIEVVWD